MDRRRLLLGISSGACLMACAAPASDSDLAVEDFMIASADANVRLFLHNKRPRRAAAPRADRTVLFVHGLTYPGSTAFDLPLSGRSWMDDLARQGFDAWSVDIRGFGRSTRPAVMDEPPLANPPLLDADVATGDLAAAVHFILAQRRLDRIAIVAWSWGTVLGARFAAAEPSAVERLVLYAPVWRWRSEQPVPKAPPGAYRSVTRDAARRNWIAGVPADQQASLIPPGWFEQWADATWASDPQGGRQSPPVVRAPNGPLVEVLAHWQSGQAMFAPERIVAPTLLVVAEWDATTPPYMARDLQPLLTNAKRTQLQVIPEGTHQVFLERQREVLFDAVRTWLLDKPR